MRRTFNFTFMILLLACSRDWKNPMDLDEDLSNTPTITKIELDTKNNALIYLDFSYSDSCDIELQRRDVNAFENISFTEQSRTVLVDTAFDKEASHNFAYRVRVTKGRYKSAYSKEKALNYSFANLNLPEHFTARSLELQGVELSWSDRSRHEDGYVIEKDKGSGYVQIADLPTNRSSYMDTISGMPQPPLQLNYRLKAYNTGMSSLWSSINLAYSGIGSPTDLRVAFASSANFIIEWEDNSNIETGYVVERKKDDGAYTELATLAANTEQHIDRMNALGTYAYRVRAQKDNYFSSYSSEIAHEIKELIPTEGLVAYYPFNGNANDESGNGNNGTLYGPFLNSDRFSNINGCYHFDGIDDYIYLKNSSLIGRQDEGTISLWIFPDKTSGILSQEMLYDESTSGTCFNLNIVEDTFQFQSIRSRNWRYIRSEKIIWNQWFHLIAIWENSYMKIFINGNQKNSNTVTIASTDENISNTYIGRCWQGLFFDGKIDDIRIYNRVLINVEIQILHHEGGWGN